MKKLLRENIGVNLCDPGLVNGSLEKTLKAQVTKEKQIKWTTSKKTFCAVNDSIQEVKRQSTEREKVFTSHIPHKGFASRIDNELL